MRQNVLYDNFPSLIPPQELRHICHIIPKRENLFYQQRLVYNNPECVPTIERTLRLAHEDLQ